MGKIVYLKKTDLQILTNFNNVLKIDPNFTPRAVMCKVVIITHILYKFLTYFEHKFLTTKVKTHINIVTSLGGVCMLNSHLVCNRRAQEFPMNDGSPISFEI